MTRTPGVEEIREWLDGRVPSVHTFALRRLHDGTGISGTGVVADGCVFPDGRTVTRWRASVGAGVAQTSVWDSVAHVQQIHGHGGATRLEFVPYPVVADMLRAVLAVAANVPDEDWRRSLVDAAGEVLGSYLAEQDGIAAEATA